MHPLTAKTSHPDYRPWYREPWPWVLIAIPALTVVACGITLWLALAHPDYLVVKEQNYQEIKAEFQAQSLPAIEKEVKAPDGEH